MQLPFETILSRFLHRLQSLPQTKERNNKSFSSDFSQVQAWTHEDSDIFHIYHLGESPDKSGALHSLPSRGSAAVEAVSASSTMRQAVVRYRHESLQARRAFNSAASDVSKRDSHLGRKCLDQFSLSSRGSAAVEATCASGAKEPSHCCCRHESLEALHLLIWAPPP